MSKKLISYVFPVYNEEKTLAFLYDVLNKELEKVDDRYDFEFIFINDGSKDKSLDELVKLHKKDSRVIVINFSRNFGHSMAFTAGVDYAKGSAVIIMDSDLQDPPSVSLQFLKKWEEGYEVVYGKRKTREDTFFKKLTAHLFYRILDVLADIKIPKDTGDFRLMDRKVVDAFKDFRERNRFIRGLIPYIGFKQTAVKFDRNKRYAGKSSYPLKKMIKLANDGITGFSTAPLILITKLGYIVSLLSTIGIIYALIVRIFFPEYAVSGWTFAVISILFIGGMQMIMLGILGTYIGRIYSEVQNRPLYIVSHIYKS